MHDSNSQRLDRDERKMRLGQAIQNEVLKGGAVESRDDFQAVIRFGKPVNHMLHLVLTLVTCTIWAWVWLIVWIISTQKNKTITLSVDEYGRVLRQEI
ncbi:hypothetical protein GCM10009799_04690 [Nocardiopsis rhodophaea]|uniref:Uncharacterized protein n=1 Tax=Nocardiopsis rhodophaea TaxID=280238 RepID=A0ABN2S8Y4_9ACTN